METSIIGFQSGKGRSISLLSLLQHLAERGIKYNCTVTEYKPAEGFSQWRNLIADKAIIDCETPTQKASDTVIDIKNTIV